MKNHSPCLLGQASVLAGDDVARRVRELSSRVGKGNAVRMLAVGVHTFDSAVDRGRMKVATLERIIATLDRLDAASKGEAAE